MNHSDYIYPILAVILLGIFFLGKAAIKETRELDAGFKSIGQKAHDAVTESDLSNVLIDLHIFYKNKCWHRSHGDRARKIMAYIRGRLDEMKRSK